MALLRQSLIPRLTLGSVPLYPTHTAFDFSHPLSYEHVFHQRSFRHTWKYISKYILLSFQHALPYLPPYHLHNPPTIQPPTTHYPPPATHIPPPLMEWPFCLYFCMLCKVGLACSSHQVCTRKDWAHTVTMAHQSIETDPGLWLLSASSFLYLSCLSSESGKKADPQGRSGRQTSFIEVLTQSLCHSQGWYYASFSAYLWFCGPVYSIFPRRLTGLLLTPNPIGHEWTL